MQVESCFFILILGLESSIGFTESSPTYTVEFTLNTVDIEFSRLS